MSLFAAAEKRAHLPVGSSNSPIQWLSAMIGGRQTHAGINVSEENAISLSTIFNAITLLSETVAHLPLAPFIKEEGEIETRKQFTSHPAYQLVHIAPNPFMSSFTWRKMMMNHVCRWGNTYNIIDRDGFGRPKELYPIHPSRATIKIDENHQMWYLVDGGKYVFEATNVLHVMGFTDDGLIGRSNVEIAKESIAQGMAVEKFGSQFFGKGINVSGFIKSQKLIGKDKEARDRLKESFAQKYGGQNGQFGVGILEDGAEWQQAETDPEKAQALEARKFNVEEVARWFNIPVPLLKQLDRATYNNVEQLDIQFTKYSISPWAVNFEQEYARKLLTEKEKKEGKVYFKHNMNALLRGDMASRGKFYESMTKTGAFSPNRILELEDENPYEGGDVHVVPSGYQTIEQLKAQENENTV